ncbi:MAG TPA: nucleoside monophosphate kinase [Chthoniobacteraceae bacterium]|jgi:adenylate kinase|nr:nucleoside monophosphate kinase [Chthoniobacteraceae bacterium]
MDCRLVLLGPPAAGKGTQAELLKKHFGFETPSVGAMLREQAAAGTPAGLRAAEYFERGLLVPDEISIDVVRQWFAGRKGPMAIDGYPRTVRQAEAFEALLREHHSAVDFALLIEADEPVIRDRVAHRLICKGCGGVFRDGIEGAALGGNCPRCAACVLSRRADDKVEALADRLIEYRDKTAPVIGYYESRGLLRRVDGNRGIADVFANISAILEAAPA